MMKWPYDDPTFYNRKLRLSDILKRRHIAYSEWRPGWETIKKILRLWGSRDQKGLGELISFLGPHYFPGKTLMFSLSKDGRQLCCWVEAPNTESPNGHVYSDRGGLLLEIVFSGPGFKGRKKSQPMLEELLQIFVQKGCSVQSSEAANGATYWEVKQAPAGK